MSKTDKTTTLMGGLAGAEVEGKKALTGLQRLGIAPILQDNANGYEVDESAYFAVEHMQSLSRDTDETEENIFADDVLYASVKAWNGITMTVTLAEMTLENMAELGFGDYDEATGELNWYPEGRNIEVAASFAMEMIDGNYRMFKAHKGIITGVQETDSQTKGDSLQVNSYELTIKITKRNYDGAAAKYKDTKTFDDLAWLKEFPKEPSA